MNLIKLVIINCLLGAVKLLKNTVKDTTGFTCMEEEKRSHQVYFQSYRKPYQPPPHLVKTLIITRLAHKPNMPRASLKSN